MVKQRFGSSTSQLRVNFQKNKNKIVMSAGLVLLLVIFSLLTVLLNQNSATASKTIDDKSNVATDSTTVILYTPTKKILAGADLASVELKEILWPKSEMPVDAVDDINLLNGMFAKKTLSYGQPIVKSDLTDSPDLAIIKIRPGMRAVTIDISAKRGVEGWAMPGSHVDVVLTHVDEGELTSKVVVENSRILSTGGDASSAKERFASGRRRVKASPTVTLELSPVHALKIETAEQLGKLSLHLRAEEDHISGGISSVNQNDLAVNPKAKGPDCNKGKMLVGGEEFWLDCDGKLVK